MYVAVKGGEAAIDNAHRLLADRRRGDRSVPAMRIEQIIEQLGLAVDRIMSEGSLYDRELAALAFKQARGDMTTAASTATLSPQGQAIERHWQELAFKKRLYTWGGLLVLVVVLTGSLWFANATNAGKFLDRLPHFFDFIGDLMGEG